MKKNGVARQCSIHNPLANAPMVSDLELNDSKIIFLMEISINLIIILNLPEFIDGY